MACLEECTDKVLLTKDEQVQRLVCYNYWSSPARQSFSSLVRPISGPAVGMGRSMDEGRSEAASRGSGSCWTSCEDRVKYSAMLPLGPLGPSLHGGWSPDRYLCLCRLHPLHLATAPITSLHDSVAKKCLDKSRLRALSGHFLASADFDCVQSSMVSRVSLLRTHLSSSGPSRACPGRQADLTMVSRPSFDVSDCQSGASLP